SVPARAPRVCRAPPASSRFCGSRRKSPARASPRNDRPPRQRKDRERRGGDRAGPGTWGIGEDSRKVRLRPARGPRRRRPPALGSCGAGDALPLTAPFAGLLAQWRALLRPSVPPRGEMLNAQTWVTSLLPLVGVASPAPPAGAPSQPEKTG